MAASRTVRVIGPAVSCDCEMGMMPARLHSPTVGLMPTMPQLVDGAVIDPSVSVPIAKGARFAATATAEPELDPEGERSSAYGLRHWPPRALQPLVDDEPRKLAHSLRFALPSSTAPAARNRAATKESLGGIDPSSASDPAVVVMRS